MKTLMLTIAAGAAAMSLMAGQASASDTAPVLLRSTDVQVAPTVFNPGDGVNFLEKVQWFWGGRHYCWYDLGWHGPGYYWCGYAGRRGYGWGGGVGWHGWARGGGYRGGYHGGGGFHGGGGGYHGGGYHGGGGHVGGGHVGGGHVSGGHGGGGGHHH